jgi:uncharacterized protein (TIGR02679 family)
VAAGPRLAPSSSATPIGCCDCPPWASRAQLAVAALGDAHALDAGSPAATLVLTALRQLAAAEPDIESTREQWAAAGVLVNELARPALALNLPGPTGAEAGEPTYLSLRRLLRSPPAWGVIGCPVFVCENPNLLAIAADQLGPRCAPLVYRRHASRGPARPARAIAGRRCGAALPRRL